MSEPIDFQSESDKRNIEEQFRLIMSDGSKWYKFFAEYTFDSDGVGLPEHIISIMEQPDAVVKKDTFSIEFWARDKREAEQRVSAIRRSLELGGQLFSEIPA